jgi:NADH-quinone oxidoreductase subunit C
MAIATSRILDVATAVTPSVTPIEHHGDVSIVVPTEHLIDVLTELRDHPDTQFAMLVDITAIDWASGAAPAPAERFHVVYLLSSLQHGARLRVKVPVREDRPHVPTAVGVWESANWYERETFDMYGIIFDGHPDLRRFYMPEDFMDEQGEPLYPLRKDFPLMGIPGSLPLPPKD